MSTLGKLASFALIASTAFLLTDPEMPAASDAITSPDASSHETCGARAYESTLDAIETRCIAAAKALAERHGAMLVLRMDDGTEKAFKSGSRTRDTPSKMKDNDYGSRLADFDPNTDRFTIYAVGDLGFGATVIDGKTGHEVYFHNGYPHYSPNGRLVLLQSVFETDQSLIFQVLDANDIEAKSAPIISARYAGRDRSSEDATFDGWVSNDAFQLTDKKTKASVVFRRTSAGSWLPQP